MASPAPFTVERLGVVLPGEKEVFALYKERQSAAIERARHAIHFGLPAMFVELDAFAETLGVASKSIYTHDQTIALATHFLRMVSDIEVAMHIALPKQSEGDNANAGIIETIANICQDISCVVCARHGKMDTVSVALGRVSDASAAANKIRDGPKRTSGEFDIPSSEEEAAVAALRSLVAMQKFSSAELLLRIRVLIVMLLERATKHMDKIVMPLGHNHSSNMF